MITDGRTLKVFLGGDTAEGLKAAALAGMNGFENLAVLDGGYQGFIATVMDPQSSVAKTDTETAAFRARARVEIAALLRAQSAPKAPKPINRVQGGCGG